MTAALIAGLVAGVLMGVVLHRGQLCFHSMFLGGAARNRVLFRGWLLGVAGASVGLSILYLLPWSDPLNRGLAFRPVGVIVGGLMIGVGMVIAQSCVSGLLYKLGSGMVGALVGLTGWATGELLVRGVDVPGPTVLQGGVDGTFAGVLGVPRLLVSMLLLAGVVIWIRHGSTVGRTGLPDWQWGPSRLGAGLAFAVVAGWVLARIGGSSYGPSSVGAFDSIASGTPRWWLIAFLVGIVIGGAVSARRGADWWVRGETPVRLAGLFVGGVLLGAGGWIAGGCNLGHGLSGVAQLNVSSWVAVAAMAVGVRLARAVVLVRSPSGSRR